MEAKCQSSSKSNYHVLEEVMKIEVKNKQAEIEKLIEKRNQLLKITEEKAKRIKELKDPAQKQVNVTTKTQTPKDASAQHLGHTFEKPLLALESTKNDRISLHEETNGFEKLNNTENILEEGLDIIDEGFVSSCDNSREILQLTGVSILLDDWLVKECMNSLLDGAVEECMDVLDETPITENVGVQDEDLGVEHSKVTLSEIVREEDYVQVLGESNFVTDIIDLTEDSEDKTCEKEVYRKIELFHKRLEWNKKPIAITKYMDVEAGNYTKEIFKIRCPECGKNLMACKTVTGNIKSENRSITLDTAIYEKHVAQTHFKDFQIDSS